MSEILIAKHSHGWLVEPFLEDETFLAKRMFGCLACYLSGRLMLILADSDDPWNGVLVATDRARHEGLKREFPLLEAHPVLGKWLFIPHDSEGFEKTVRGLTRCCLAGDERIGVEPGTRRKKKKSKARGKK